MTEPRHAPAGVRTDRDDDVERLLGRAVALGLPVVCVLAALGVGAVAGVGAALLVVAAGVLVGGIALLWASVRTLTGDAPLSADFEALSARRHGVDALAEQRRQVLHALKDLEAEHELGKIDDADYASLVADYREQAKGVMRKMDVKVAPLRAEAERIARDYLRERGLTGASPAEPVQSQSAGQADGGVAPVEPARERLVCAACGASNELDAVFCKQCGARVKGHDDAHA